jgi:quercetin dioxygenase-like cupin family protein
MERHDIVAAIRTLNELRLTPQTTDAEAMAATRLIAPFNQCLLGVVRFAGQTPWERHPDGDELLYVLEGGVDVTVLTDSGPVTATVPAGSLFVVPSGLWHRQNAQPTATILFATPAVTTETTWDDPSS